VDNMPTTDLQSVHHPILLEPAVHSPHQAQWQAEQGSFCRATVKITSIQLCKM